MKWTIYKHTNKLNGKCYIGQTFQKLEERWGQNGKNYNPIYKFGKAISAYGWDGFLHEIIEDNIFSQEVADEREKYWIEYYDSYKHGYNMTKGGAGVFNDAICKGIYQVNANKEIVAHYNSIKEAADAIKISATNIGQCLIGKQLTSGGYYFFLDTIDTNKITLPKSKYKREIICVESQEVYTDIISASNTTSIGYGLIAKCCSRGSITAGGLHWAYLDEYDEFWEPLKKSEKNFDWLKEKIICVETGDIWDSITDCSIETGISTQNLSQNCCYGHRTAKGKHYAKLSEYDENWAPATKYDTQKRKKVSTLKKRVYCFQTDTFYESATECAIALNIPANAVSRCAKANGDLIKTHGYNFCYEDDWFLGWQPRESIQGQNKDIKVETKIKMRNNFKKSKPVKCVENNIVYPSTKEAERQTGINASTIERVCNKKPHCITAGGFHWIYLDSI